ncbi:acyl carrier protein [Streptomyces sp. SID5910]|uniref:acyl carrier protein n=1 Tax=Streptomyces sp. SID5910 TaxID=2690312 RepID=UPI001370070E|nr:acyl carrier protein [Streptomyces sp. SID5910]MYR41101.1 hypothetical protein [Streptomyces sp. SID5910]
MNTSPLQERLTGLLCDYFEVDPQAMDPDATLQDLGIDSLSLAELFVVLEEEDGIKLFEASSGLSTQTTLAEALRFIEEQAAAQNPRAAGAVEEGAPAPSGAEAAGDKALS